MIESTLRILKFPYLKSLSYRFFLFEAFFISIAMAIIYESYYLLLSPIVFIVFIYFESTADYISSLLALAMAMIPSIIFSFLTRGNFSEPFSIILSSTPHQLLAFTIFWTGFIFHKKGFDNVRESIEPFAKKLRFYLPLKNGNFRINISGKNLQSDKVKRYTEDTLFYLMPFYDKEININIKEVETIEDHPDFDFVAGTAEDDLINNSVNIMVASYAGEGRKIESSQMMRTLAHELVHAKQYCKDELNGDIWHGREYSGLEWKDRPWEKEAVYLEEKIFNKFWY